MVRAPEKVGNHFSVPVSVGRSGYTTAEVEGTSHAHPARWRPRIRQAPGVLEPNPNHFLLCLPLHRPHWAWLGTQNVSELANPLFILIIIHPTNVTGCLLRTRCERTMGDAVQLLVKEKNGFLKMFLNICFWLKKQHAELNFCHAIIGLTQNRIRTSAHYLN